MSFINPQHLPPEEIFPGFSAFLTNTMDLTFGPMDIQAGASFPPHSHPNVQVTFLIEGTLRFEIGGDIQIMDAGMIAYVPEGVTHSAEALTPCKVFDCFLSVLQEPRI